MQVGGSGRWAALVQASAHACNPVCCTFGRAISAPRGSPLHEHKHRLHLQPARHPLRHRQAGKRRLQILGGDAGRRARPAPRRAPAK